MNWRDTLIAMIVLVALWQGVVWATDVPSFILPSPLKTMTTFWAQKALIFEHALVTLAEVLAGIILGTALGVASALHLAQSRMAARIGLPIMVFLQALPVFALAPVLTLWFGYGIWSKIIMTVMIIYFPVTSAFYEGLKRAQSHWADLVQVMEARPGRALLRLWVPYALPDLASGLRMAAVYAPIGAVIGEWVGSSNGLGYLMLLANGRAKTDLMFAALITLALLTVLLHAGSGWVAGRLNAYAAGHNFEPGK